MEKLRRQVIVKSVKYVVTYVTLLTLFVTDFTNIVKRNRAVKIIYNIESMLIVIKTQAQIFNSFST